MIAIQIIAVQFGFHSNIVGKASEMTQSAGLSLTLSTDL